MSLKTTYLFVISNGKVGAGELDYMRALEHAITEEQRKKVNLLICKREFNSFHENASRINKTYHSPYPDAPIYSAEMLDGIQGGVNVIGVGNSTLETALHIHADMQEKGIPCQTSYITHIVNNQRDLERLCAHQVTTFIPSDRTVIANINPALADQLKLVEISSTPHTNTEHFCQIEYQKFKNSPNGAIVNSLYEDEVEFVFAVINAGYGAGETKIHKPYTKAEALDHGYALGQGMAPNTALIAAHGGPRNLIDETIHGEMTMDGFIEGYVQAQQKKGGTPLIIQERYLPGLAYDAIKAGYILTKHKNAKAFISNAEGYGTMDGAILHVHNQEKLLAMFPYKALYEDLTGQRQKNIDNYNARGIAILTVDKNKNLIINKKSDEKHTPCTRRNAAEQIISHLGL
jgi:hypothetical protein